MGTIGSRVEQYQVGLLVRYHQSLVVIIGPDCDPKGQVV